MRLGPEIELSTITRVVVEGSIFVVASPKEITKRLKNKVVVVNYKGEYFLGRVTEVDMDDTALPYEVEYFDKNCTPGVTGINWFACMDVFPLGENEYEKIKKLIPEKFI